MSESEAADGRWVDESPLPELAAPPPHLIQVHGAQLVRVYTIDHADARRHGGFTEALLLAWAPIPGGDWAALAAWLGAWQEGGRTTGKGRFGWLRIVMPADIEHGRIRAVTPHLFEADFEWHGHAPEAEFSIAVREAAATLPEDLYEQALRPRVRPGGE